MKIFYHLFTYPQQETEIESFIEKEVSELCIRHMRSKICVSMPKWLLNYFKSKHRENIKDADINNLVYFWGARVYLCHKNEVTVFHEDFELIKEKPKTYLIN